MTTNDIDAIRKPLGMPELACEQKDAHPQHIYTSEKSGARYWCEPGASRPTVWRDESPQLRAELEKLRAELAKKHEQLAAAQNALRSLGQAYADLKTDNDELAAEVDRVRQQRDEALAELERNEREHGDTIDDRDRYQQTADNLAEAIAKLTGAELGEHSSMNNPWENALQAATERTEAVAS